LQLHDDIASSGLRARTSEDSGSRSARSKNTTGTITETTTFSDAQGNPNIKITKMPDGSVQVEWPDARGKLIGAPASIDKDGNIHATSKDDSGRITGEKVFDKNGKILSESHTSYNRDGSSVTTTQFADGRTVIVKRNTDDNVTENTQHSDGNALTDTKNQRGQVAK
jgi:hypothetical protein